MNESLQRALKKLRLSGMTQSLDVRLQEATGNGLNHMEFLELILQDELLVRNERQIQRRVKAAVFRELKTLEDFDWQFNPSIKKKQIYDLATCQFIEKGLDVCWLGPPATAILDRFLHHAEIITITGRSYRLKDRAAQRQPQRQPEKNLSKKDQDNQDNTCKKQGK